ncbi:MAG: MazG family protein [Clostridia bacterium]|jgi:tetrapyrrole methylase family protein/MazG family protein|nr:MazG family protein [Clostridia bacterium]
MNENASKMAERFDSDSYTVADLLEIMKILRAKDGCPWDKEQTHESIRKNLIEETYEVVEAIDNSDDALMREELGDLLLQVVFHAQIACDRGAFSFDDVADEICRKLIVRHPHIFADTVAGSSEAVLENWDAIKARTKKRESLYDEVDSVSKALPSLMRAQKISKKLRKADKREDMHTLVGEMLFNAAAIAEEYGIDAEKALYDACDRRNERVKNGE